MTDKEAMAMALDALETEVSIDWTNNDEFNASAEKMHEAIAALNARLTQPEQEPVGSVVRWVDGSLIHGWFGEPPPEGTLLYAHPPQRTEQNFCSRCGKRTPDLITIHTCTPPKEGA